MNRQELILTYMPKVKFWAQLCRGCGLDNEDLWGYGYIGLINGVDRFKPEKCTCGIEKYLKTCVLREIRQSVSFYGGLCRIPNKVGSAMSKLNHKHGGEMSATNLAQARRVRFGKHGLSSKVKDRMLYTDDTHPYEEVENKLSKLRKTHRRVIEDCVIREKSAVEVGRSMGLSRQRVNQLKNEGLTQLRKVVQCSSI
jgi:RNA polymerase sigma factor (sigma-70 family)